ncbi:MAG: beta-phosphoglucomutase [Eubacteriales bacterium]|nr:beta-phosphoglucomutase [Eubacteriales bacterium]
MSKQPQGMIFDLDGVLVDTAKYHYLAWRRLAAERFDLDFTPEDNEQFKGVNRVACMNILCKMAGVTLPAEEFDALATKKNNWYIEYVKQMTPDEVLPGAREFVQACRGAGLKTAIASASKNCALVLERTGIAPLFDEVVDGTSVTRAKPDPEVFVTAANRLGLPCDVCVVFEDAQAGLDGAAAGGMRSVAIGKPEDLTGYTLIAPSLAQVSVEQIKAM